MEEVESRYLEVMVHSGQEDTARAIGAIHERQVFGRTILLFENADREKLATMGDVRTPSIADLFVGVMTNQSGKARGGGE